MKPHQIHLYRKPAIVPAIRNKEPKLRTLEENNNFAWKRLEEFRKTYYHYDVNDLSQIKQRRFDFGDDYYEPERKSTTPTRERSTSPITIPKLPINLLKKFKDRLLQTDRAKQTFVTEIPVEPPKEESINRDVTPPNKPQSAKQIALKEIVSARHFRPRRSRTPNLESEKSKSGTVGSFLAKDPKEDTNEQHGMIIKSILTTEASTPYVRQTPIATERDYGRPRTETTPTKSKPNFVRRANGYLLNTQASNECNFDPSENEQQTQVIDEEFPLPEKKLSPRKKRAITGLRERKQYNDSLNPNKQKMKLFIKALEQHVLEFGNEDSLSFDV